MLPISMCSEVRSLDPSVGIDSASQVIIKMLFEGLVSLDLTGTLVPAAAERYEVSPDLKTYTFFLRDSRWSNGSPVTAHDFEYSWKRVITGGAKGTAVHNCYPIKNVQEYAKRKKSIDEIGVKALDDKTLLVELERPTPYFLEVISTSSFFPVSAETDKKSPGWMRESGKGFVCNGPFVLDKHKQNDELIVLKNPYYWDRAHVKLPGIKVAIIEEGLTQLHMYEKDELTWAGKPLTR
ncbi:MAG: peptide ABC transporter substrate-binding protein, partial [Chlamydiales bacterium]